MDHKYVPGQGGDIRHAGKGPTFTKKSGSSNVRQARVGKGKKKPRRKKVDWEAGAFKKSLGTASPTHFLVRKKEHA